MILQQIESDSQFLKKNNIIDYSLLIGIHYPDSHFRKSKTNINEGIGIGNTNIFSNTNIKNKEEIKKINPSESEIHQSSIQNSQNNPNLNQNQNKIKRSIPKYESSKITMPIDKLLNIDEYTKNQRNSNANANIEENKNEEPSLIESEISHYDGQNNMSDSNSYDQNDINKNEEILNGFKLVLI
jgi:hypothetical protein